MDLSEHFNYRLFKQYVPNKREITVLQANTLKLNQITFNNNSK